jgi:hypothetical protein
MEGSCSACSYSTAAGPVFRNSRLHRNRFAKEKGEYAFSALLNRPGRPWYPIIPYPTGRLFWVAFFQALRARLRSYRPSGTIRNRL